MESVLMRRCRSRAGETIAETLLALLVSALALTMLAGAITTATNVTNVGNAAMEDYYAGMNAAAAGSDSDSSAHGSGHVSIKLSDNTGPDLLTGNSVGVDYHVNARFGGKPVVAYADNTAVSEG